MYTWGRFGEKLFGFPGSQNAKVATKCLFFGASYVKHSMIQESPNLSNLFLRLLGTQ